jgi:hypothetical protein
MLKWLCNAYEIAEYRVVKDIPQTVLRAGCSAPDFSYNILGTKFIMLGTQTMIHEAFDFYLSIGSIERKF